MFARTSLAFRHGDIESILSTLSKNVGSKGFGGGVAGILAGVAKVAMGGGKGDRFTSLDVKRVYFVRFLSLTSDLLVSSNTEIWFLCTGKLAP